MSRFLPRVTRTTRRIIWITLFAGGCAALVALIVGHADFITQALAQSSGWDPDRKPEGLSKAGNVMPTAPVPVAKAIKAAAVTKPATKQSPSQTHDQLHKAGVKRCLTMARAVEQATLAGTSEYAAASTWNARQPDSRFLVSMIGQKFAATDATIANGISGVFATPTATGKCDAASLQVIPTTDSCAKTQAQILETGKSLGTLAGVPILQNAANAQVMLIPATNNSCVVVALSTIYSD